MPLFSPQLSPDQAAPQVPPPQTSDPSLSDPSQASGGYSGTPTQTSAAPAGLPPAVQNVAKHAIFGRAVRSLVHSIEGTTPVYRANPQTGQIEESTVQNKPGQLFRNILMGSLIGGAAASERSSGPGGGGFLGGFARGGAASIGYRQQQDQAKFKRAQEQMKGELDREKLDDTENLHAVAVAHTNLQIAALQQNLHHADQDMIDRRNASARAYAKSLEDQGAQPAKFIVNGKPVDSMSAVEFAKAYTADPSIAKPSMPGFQREFIDVTDTTGLHFDGTYWHTDSGDLVNMSDKTQIRPYDVPTNTLKTFTQTPGTVINKLAGEQLVDPTKSYSINGEGRLALRTNGLKNDATATRTAATKARNDRKNKLNSGAVAIEAKRASAVAKAHSNYSSTINKPLADDETEARAAQERDRALQQAEVDYQREMNALHGTSSQTFTVPRFNNGQNPQANSKTFTVGKWKAAHPNEDASAAVAEATKQGYKVVQ